MIFWAIKLILNDRDMYKILCKVIASAQRHHIV